MSEIGRHEFERQADDIRSQAERVNEIQSLITQLGENIKHLGKWLSRIEERMDGLNEKLDNTNTIVDRINASFTRQLNFRQRLVVGVLIVIIAATILNVGGYIVASLKNDNTKERQQEMDKFYQDLSRRHWADSTRTP